MLGAKLLAFLDRLPIQDCVFRPCAQLFVPFAADEFNMVAWPSGPGAILLLCFVCCQSALGPP